MLAISSQLGLSVGEGWLVACVKYLSLLCQRISALVLRFPQLGLILVYYRRDRSVRSASLLCDVLSFS